MRMNVFIWLHTRSCMPTTNELSLVSPAKFLPASVRRESHPLNRLFTNPQAAARNTRGNSIGIFPLLGRLVWTRVWSVKQHDCGLAMRDLCESCGTVSIEWRESSAWGRSSSKICENVG